MLGLFAFAYALLHLAFYVAVDQFFDWRLLWQDVIERKFMAVGFAALVLLVPLAVTSTSGWVSRLGYRRWKRLHRLSYLAAILEWCTSSGGSRPTSRARSRSRLFWRLSSSFVC